MNTINELDAVALTCDQPEHGLVHGNRVAFEVEFVGYDGHTVALLTLERSQVRPLDRTPCNCGVSVLDACIAKSRSRKRICYLTDAAIMRSHV